LRHIVILKFKIQGNLRFLSHQETVRVFQRALIRAGIKLRYSKGFNPRPRLSVPLPRTVGVESDDDLLCFEFAEAESTDNQKQYGESGNFGQLRTALSAELPAGCTVLDVDLIKAKAVPMALSADYVFTLQSGIADKKLKETAERLPSIRELYIDRRTDEKGNTRRVNVAEFIESVEVNDPFVSIKCRITPSGTIRVEEIAKLLAMEQSKLAGAVKRTNVQWTGGN